VCGVLFCQSGDREQTELMVRRKGVTRILKRKSDIIVVGSLNMDIVTSVSRMPELGETMFGNGTSFIAGEKGSNQAVAAAKLEAFVSMVGRVGRDSFGVILKENLMALNVRCDHVETDDEITTGIAQVL
jgi:ribokinase